MGHELKSAWQQIRRRPAFAVVVVLILAFGLGATTAAFSELYGNVLKPLPYLEPDRLVIVHNQFAQLEAAQMGTSAFDLSDLTEHHELFSSLGVYYFLDLIHTGGEHAENVNAVAASASLFRTLGVKPLLGRIFSPDEERFQGPHALILSEAYWQSAFGRDPQVLQRTMQLNGEEYRIVGVMPRSFQFPNEVTQMWAPVVFQPKELASRAGAGYYLHMIARLAPGLTMEQASAHISDLSRQMALKHDGSPRGRTGWRFFLLQITGEDHGATRRWMEILFGAVGGLLMVVCFNVAGLFVVRATERQFDFSLRMALGAARWRIARQALSEVLLLAACGGAAGMLLANAAIRGLSRYGPAGKTIAFESPVFWFGIALTMLTGVACGLYPAWAAGRRASIEALKQGGHQRTPEKRKRRWQQILIVTQVAVATALLVSGGLLLHSFIRLLETPLGFDARNVLTMEIGLPRSRYPAPESRVRFFGQVVQRVEQIPGVQSAAGCSLLPFGYGENVTSFDIAGRPKPRVNWYADVNSVSPEYLETMQISLLRGRFFTADELVHPQPVAVIDATLAQRFFRGQNPIGQTIRTYSARTPGAAFRIIGVVGAVKTTGVDIATPPTIYFCGAGGTLVIRSKVATGALASDVQNIVAGIDKEQPLSNVMPLETFIGRSLRTRRFVVLLVMLFGATGALLSALGLYGLLSYWIAARKRELGIRMAVGATGSSIAALIWSSGLRLVIAGIVFGCAGAAVLQRTIASQLYGVRFYDAVTWAEACGVIAGAGLVACLIPAARAAKVNVLESLQAE